MTETGVGAPVAGRAVRRPAPFVSKEARDAAGAAAPAVWREARRLARAARSESKEVEDEAAIKD